MNLGLEVLLQEHQSLAHVGNLGNIYFLPLLANFRFLIVSAIALSVVMLVVLTWTGAALVGRLRRAAPQCSRTLSRVRAITGWVLLASLGMIQELSPNHSTRRLINRIPERGR